MSTPSPQITFYNQHVPSLRDGAYQVEVSQNMSIKDDTIKADTQPTSQPITFHISGPKFAIDSSLIHSVYPPKGGKGDYHADLPTLTLNRSTLPWERKPTTATMGDNSASWLFLLLIDETEQKYVQEHTNASLKNISSKFNPAISSDELERLPEKINYINLAQSMSSVLPKSLTDLEYLSYARIKDGGEEQAVILCNRLPKSGHNSTVYLVSLENNYNGTGSSAFTGIPNNGGYLLPYLYKWEFHSFQEQLYCLTEKVANKIKKLHPHFNAPTSNSPLYNTVHHTTKGFTSALNGAGIISSNPYLPDLIKASKLPGSTFHELLSNLAGGFGPLTLEPQDHGLARIGTLELPYLQMTRGVAGMLQASTQTWFRGPLTGATVSLGPLANKFPQKGSSTPSLPAHAHEFIINIGAGQPVEATYAAAFELGRLTALDDTAFATTYYQWKNDAATALRAQQQSGPSRHSLAASNDTSIPGIPSTVTNKVYAWKTLSGIPYRYLLADPGLLPNESIRFFYLDKNWINAFLCGAFSIGHTVQADIAPLLTPLLMDPSEKSQIMGFFINSLAVSGWPNFEVDVTYTDHNTETITHTEENNLDVNISMFLLSKEFQQLDFHLHHGKVHTGFLYDDGNYEKLNGEQVVLSASYPPPLEGPVPYINMERVINSSQIAGTIGTGTVADFAFKMLEGKAKVQFNITSPAP